MSDQYVAQAHPFHRRYIDIMQVRAGDVRPGDVVKVGLGRTEPPGWRTIEAMPDWKESIVPEGQVDLFWHDGKKGTTTCRMAADNLLEIQVEVWR